METVFQPYEGTQPYIFISYAHRDAKRVLSLIRLMQEQGYRIWYDQGIEAGSFRTHNVENMHNMFATCEMLTELDISAFDTAKVRDMGGMFSGCEKLENLDLSHFVTSATEDMSVMFCGCGCAETADLSGFDVSNVQAAYRFMDDGILINGEPWENFFSKAE